MIDFGAIGTATSLATRMYGEAKRAAILVTELVWRLRPPVPAFRVQAVRRRSGRRRHERFDHPVRARQNLGERAQAGVP
jgi:hypothetical protein